MNPIIRSFLVAAFVALTFHWQPTLCSADDPILGPNEGIVPIQSLDLRRLGYSATIQFANQQAPGYFAVRIVITGVGAAPADQRLTFRLATDPSAETPPGNGLVIDVPVTIQQGARTTTVTRYLPKWSVGQSLNLSIWKNGILLEDSRMQIGESRKLPFLQSLTSRAGNSPTLNLSEAGFARECRQDWLLIADPDQISPATTSMLRDMILENVSAADPSSDPTEFDKTAERTRNFYRSSLNEMPTDWRGYQPYDAVVMNSATSKKIAMNSSLLRSLRSWILQGGTAIVYDVKTMQEALDNLLFGPSQGRPSEQTLASLDSQSISPLQGWKDRATNVLMQLRQNSNQRVDRNIGNRTALSVKEATELAERVELRAVVNDNEKPTGKSFQSNAARASESVQKIRVQPVGAGLVLSIPTSAGSADQYGGVPSPLQWRIVKQRLDNRSSTMLRNGTEPVRGNRRFRQWLVPGVRQPPVYSFIALLTGFVILVGPVAYRQTSKYGRSHLMFAIAPILAIFTTLAMLGYGVISDGFQTKVRIRQLTWIDGRSGDAGERVRATYFAGIRPRAGLRFPGHATVMRQAESDGSTWEETNRLPPSILGRITVSEDAQIFGSSFLPSRDQRQFVFHAPRMNVGSIQLLPPSTGGTEPRLENGLRFPLRTAIVRDHNGDYWGSKAIEAGATNTCVKLNSKSASSWLGELHSEYRPMAATGESQSRPSRDIKIIDPLGAIARELRLHPRYEDGLFEDWLRSHLQLQGEIPKDHFVATAEVSEDVVAVEGSDVVDSVRYLFGTLP